MTSTTDLELLALLAEHRVAIVPQAARWLGVTDAAARRRIARLAGRDLVTSEHKLTAAAALVQITGRGLREIGSRASPPGLRLDEFRHDVGVVWLWTAARSGALGSVAEVEAERSLRAHDYRADRAGDRTAELKGVGLGAHGPSGRPKRHYPDLMLRTTGGARVAVELELTDKGPRRLREIMETYASDSRIDAVLYVVEGAGLAHQVRRAADAAGLQSTVQVRLLAEAGVPGVPGTGRARPARRDRSRTAERTPSRDADRLRSRNADRLPVHTASGPVASR